MSEARRITVTGHGLVVVSNLRQSGHGLVVVSPVVDVATENQRILFPPDRGVGANERRPSLASRNLRFNHGN